MINIIPEQNFGLFLFKTPVRFLRFKAGSEYKSEKDINNDGYNYAP